MYPLSFQDGRQNPRWPPQTSGFFYFRLMTFRKRFKKNLILTIYTHFTNGFAKTLSVPPDPAVTSSDSPVDDLDLSDESKAFDINDILEGVVFEEEPKPLELTTGHLTDRNTGEGGMMMEETSSVTSENLDQVS